MRREAGGDVGGVGAQRRDDAGESAEGDHAERGVDEQNRSLVPTLADW